MRDSLSSVASGPRIGDWRTMLPLIVAALLFASSAWLLAKDLHRLPKVRVPSESRIYPLEEYGAVVFGTFFETAPVYGLLIAGFCVRALGIGTERRIRAKNGAKAA